MIIGRHLDELNQYIGLNKNLDIAINYILNHDLFSFTPGKYNIYEKNVILLREDYEPREIEKCYFESHKEYLDIQIVLSGKEGFGYCHKSNQNLIVTDEYNQEKDVTKYSGFSELVFEMVNQSFTIVYPDDIHMPKIKLPDSSAVKKAIFKVKL